MRALSINEIHCSSALNKLKRKIPYGWDLNVYRGCQHGCVYCYAINSNKYLENQDFFRDISVKVNIVDELEKELMKKSWKYDVINIGGVTDSYQPVEAKYKIMRDVLKLLIKYRSPAIISTKSDLILRDIDLIDELSKITYINIAATITTVDEDQRRILEPLGVSSEKRFKMLREFSKTNASVGMHIMPIIPRLTDNKENIIQLLEKGKESNIDYVLPGFLYLRGKFRGSFFKTISDFYPELYDELQKLYSKGGVDKYYKDEFYNMFNHNRKKLGISNSYSRVYEEKIGQTQEVQLSLFD
jgi:DNA repair photolyase